MSKMSPIWMEELLGSSLTNEGAELFLDKQLFTIRSGILRSEKLVLNSQHQTKETFA